MSFSIEVHAPEGPEKTSASSAAGTVPPQFAPLLKAPFAPLCHSAALHASEQNRAARKVPRPYPRQIRTSLVQLRIVLSLFVLVAI
ncbi:MAG: hypothetical protein II381_10945 [Victivallales bacterium]|nr:hypothetical protein [Victivallales bacterium]